MLNFFKQNLRYFLAILAIFGALAVNRNFFLTPAKTTDNCQSGQCAAGEEPSLDDKKKAVYFNDVGKIEAGKFYRLKLRAKADHDTRVKVEISTAFDERQSIGDLEIKSGDNFVYTEKAFPASGNYTDLVFQKENPDGAAIFLEDVRITELNIASLEQYQKLQPTVFGEVKTDAINQEQTEKNSASFLQLNNKGVILGQVFRSRLDYISGATFDIDVTRDGNGGGRKYRLELREVEVSDKGIKLGKPIRSSGFSIDEIDQLRDRNGKVRFSLFSPVEIGKDYFIGINVDKVEPNQFNNLVLKGSGQSDSYPDGFALFKMAGEEKRLEGDLYFKVYGAEFKSVNGEKLLVGGSVEDIGGGAGVFVYQTRGDFTDYIDLSSYTPDVEFSQGKRILNGDAKGDSNYVYKFNSIYPMKRMEISARQASDSWAPAKLLYSLDGENWSDISSAENEDGKIETALTFDTLPKTLYLKVTYGEKTEEGQDSSYGIRDLKVKGESIVEKNEE